MTYVAAGERYGERDVGVVRVCEAHQRARELHVERFDQVASL
jgi:hypothetical protein